MSFKIALFCAQALLIQAISSQFVGAFNGYPEGYGWPGCEGWNWAEMSLPCGEWGAAGARMRAAEWENAALAEARYGYGLGGFAPASMAASNGGGLAVTSSSPIAPNGVSLLSENAFEGPLAVAGEIPFLGTVGLEGALPTAGAGGVAYSCGNGNVGILSEDLNGPYGAGAYGGAYGAYGAGAYGAPFAGPLAGAALSSAYGINGINGINRGCGCRI